jgi:hypothetical protein
MERWRDGSKQGRRNILSFLGIAQPLTAPWVNPEMMAFRNTRTMIAMGKIEMIEAAKILP